MPYNGPLPLLVPQEEDHPQVVAVRSDTVIPPHSEVIIPGTVANGFGDGLEGMLEPSVSLSNHCEVMVAYVVCRVKQGALPIRVINVTGDELMLKTGMKIATFHTGIEIEDCGEGGPSEQTKSNPSWSVESLLSQFNIYQKGLDPVDVEAVSKLLSRHEAVFSTGESDLGRTHWALHRIDTGDADPVKLPPRRVPLHLQQEVAEHVKQMQENDVICPSCSPWAASVVLVRKRDWRPPFLCRLL